MRWKLTRTEVVVLATVLALCGALLAGVWLITQPGGSDLFDRDPPCSHPVNGRCAPSLEGDVRGNVVEP